MNIVQIGLDVQPESGGTYRTIGNFAAAIRSLGHTANILNCTSAHRPKVDQDSVHIPTTTTPLLKSYHYCGAESRAAIAKALEGCDLIIVHGPYAHAFQLVASYARRTATPYAVVLHGGLDPYVFSYRRVRKHLWLRFVGRRFLTEASSVICATDAEAVKALSIHADIRPMVVHWPVQVCPQRVNGDSAANTIKARLGLRQDVRLALFVGRIHPVKRVLELAKAFTLSAGPLGWALLIVGPPSVAISAKHIQEVCAESPGCVYVGPKYGEELAMYYEAAEVLFCLSVKENFGYAVAEACAAGVPVAVSSGVDLATEICDSGAGWVFHEGEDMASFIVRVLSLPKDALRNVGGLARRWSEATLSWQRFVEAIAVLVSPWALGRLDVGEPIVRGKGSEEPAWK